MSTNSSRPQRQKTIHHYRDTLSQEDITVPDDPRSVKDLAIARKESNLQDILDLAEKHGYNSVFDVGNEILQRRDNASMKYTEQWMKKDGTAQLLSSCQFHPRFNCSPPLSDEVYGLAEDLYRSEFVEIATELPNPIQQMSLEAITNFSLGKLWISIQNKLPRFTNMLQHVISPRWNSTGDKAESDKAESDKASDGDFDELVMPKSIVELSHYPPEYYKRRGKRQTLLMTVVICVLSYARSQKSNLLQTHVGYFLAASRTPKAVIEVLHRLGLSLKYDSITDPFRNVAKLSAEDLKTFVSTFPSFFVSFDNANFYARVRDETLHNIAEMLNYTVGCIAFNPLSQVRCLFTRADIDWTELMKITPIDIIPTTEDLRYQRRAFEVGIYDTLVKYCVIHLSKAKETRPEMKPFKIPEIYRIPLQKLKVFNLPTYHKNEAKIDEITAILRQTIKDLGYAWENLRDKIIMFKGDYLTVRNIRYLPWQCKC
jgi:hypothetical protein